ncbi:hypothetical protein TCAL_14209 [Tigriopus californicus]|uniref:Nucleolar protein 11 n=1 Tax=Tigriopus californicus TaxID=6832 RepID=A0A553NSP7_TIGCA|nr:hypothetical protein TCAL_14209 [Tigriopus californicus]
MVTSAPKSHVLRDPILLPGLESAGSLRSQSCPESGSDLILITVGERAALKYNLAELAVQKTWFPPTFLKLTSPILLETGMGNHIGVLNGAKLIYWDGIETKLDQIPTLALKSKVRDLIVDEQGQIYVVFQSNDIQTVDYVRHHPDMVAHDMKDKYVRNVLKYGVFQYKGQIMTWYLTQNEKKNHQIKVFRNAIDPDSSQLSATEIRSRTFPAGISGMQTILTTLGPALVWMADSYLMMQRILAFKDEMGLETEEDQPKKICLLTDTKAGSRVVLEPLNPDNLVVFAGEAKGNECTVSVVNLKFGGCVAQTSVSISGSDWPSVACHKDKIIYKDGNQVRMIVIQDLPNTLSKVIAAQSQSAKAKTKTVSQVQDMYDKVFHYLEQEDVKGLSAFLRQSKDVPELIILNVIEFLIQIEDERFEKIGPLAPQIQRERLLVLAFGLPITDALMFQYLGQLEFGTLIKMLEFLDLSLKLETGSHNDRFLALIQWTSLLLNSQYGNILRAKTDEKVLSVVESLLNTIATFEGLSSDYASLMPLIKLIEEKKLQSTEYANTAYCIEIIDL